MTVARGEIYADAVLTTYEIQASDLGTAINIATRRAHNDGFTHANIQSTRQVGPQAWEIVMFVSNSQAVTARR